MSEMRFTNGVLTYAANDETRTVMTYDENGNVTSTVPYDDAQNVAADAAEAQQLLEENATEIGNKLTTVDMVAMQAILNQTNADLRADPSQELKQLATATRRLIRKVNALLDGTT